MTTTTSSKPKIRLLREERGLSQQELARYAGLSQTTTSVAERAPQCASRKTLRAISDALGLELVQLCEALGIELQELR